MPVGSMLMSLDMRDEVARLSENDIPVLAEWGCFDRVVTARTAHEFCELTGTEVVWVPGGHSWMLPRPRGQGDILRHLSAGQDFVDRMVERRRQLGVEYEAAGQSVAGPSVAGQTVDDAAAAAAVGAAVVEPIDIFRRTSSG
jgi:hypothetical protein